MKAYFQDRDGEEKPLVMGCYGIGVSRIVAATIEQNHDDNGIIFPVPLAPYQVSILNLGLNNEAVCKVVETIYAQMKELGIDVFLDDRDERPGVKFKDADLLGFPFRITVGKRYTENGMIEIRRRRDGFTEEVALDELAERVQTRLNEEMPKT